MVIKRVLFDLQITGVDIERLSFNGVRVFPCRSVASDFTSPVLVGQAVPDSSPAKG